MDSGVKEDKEEIIHIPATDTERQEAQTGPQAVAVAAGGGGVKGAGKGAGLHFIRAPGSTGVR